MKGEVLMKRSLTIILLLSLLMNLSQSCLAQQDNETEYECFCTLTCTWEYTIWNAACLGETGIIDIAYSGATTAKPEQKATCESKSYAEQQCREKTRDDVYDTINEIGEICSGAAVDVFGGQEFKGSEGSCFLQEKSCFTLTLLGSDDLRLDTLRQFRDKVLSKTPAGKKLIELYYGYSDVIIELLVANPAIKAQAKELLEQIIPQIEALMQGKSASLSLSDPLLQSADALIAALDAGLANPLKEKIDPLRKDIEATGLMNR